MNIIVAGGGIAGSAVTRLARAAGHHVTLISDSPPHSLAATAVLRRGYHTADPAGLKAWQASMDLYHQWGIPLTAGGHVTSYRRPGTHQDPDWTFIDPAAPLLTPDLKTTVTAATAGQVTVSNGGTLTADVVVLAPGAVSAFTPEGKTTWGVTWVHPDPGALTNPDRVTVHHYAPYKTITAAVVSGRARLGSSTGPDPRRAMAAADRMLTLAAANDLITTLAGWQPVTGARIRTATHLARTPNGCRWIGGFHRTGYALAPAAAAALVTSL